MTPGGVTCARLRLAHVTPPGVTSKNPHTLYTIQCVTMCTMCALRRDIPSHSRPRFAAQGNGRR